MAVTFIEHLKYRGYRPYLKAFLDTTKEIITFPLWCGTKFIGYQKYDWRRTKKEERYYTYVTAPYKGIALWGNEYLQKNKTVYIVEGIWDAIRLMQFEYQAIAILTCSPSKQLIQYVHHVYPNSVVVCDNDDNKSGLRLKKLGHKHITVPEPYKDVNEITNKEFLQGLLNEVCV